MNALRNIWIVFKREFFAQFNIMLGYVFIVIFVALAMAMTFWFGRENFFQDASLERTFFQWPPWLLLFLAPAVGMRLWSEEHRTGTIELLLTTPIPTWNAIVGKYLAGLAVIGIAVLCTFPIIITVTNLGDPDDGTLWAGYLAMVLYGAACLAITCAISALTRSIVACLIISMAICFKLMLIGFPPVQDFLIDNLGASFAEMLASFSNFSHYNDMIRGVIRLDNILYYVSLIGFSLFVTSVAIQSKRA